MNRSAERVNQGLAYFGALTIAFLVLVSICVLMARCSGPRVPSKLITLPAEVEGHVPDGGPLVPVPTGRRLA